MRTEEQMRFQGIEPSSFKKDVSEPELQRQVGNAMSLCVIERLLNKLITAAGFVNQQRPDRWENGEAIKELEESREMTLIRDDDTVQEDDKLPEAEMGEIHYWNKHPAFRFTGFLTNGVA